MKYQLLNPNGEINKNLSILEQILINRGIEQDNIQHYLNTTDEDILNPLLLNNMRAGAEMLVAQIIKNEPLMVQVDSDCDGYTSAALLINYINSLFPTYAQNNILYRIHNGKEHGLISETIPEGITLAIAPDSSSNDYEVHKELFNRGIKTLVLDHHEAETESAFACVINNQLCDYPTKSLSGVGIVYKFCSYIDSLLGINNADNFLDLVALGMIADVMDLRDFETHHLIKKGLKNIQNHFLAAMVEKQSYSLGNELTPIGIAFYIAPYVNATVRTGNPEEKELLFQAMLDFKSDELIPSTKRGCKGEMEKIVEQACRNCTNIKNKQTKIRDENLQIIDNLIHENNLLDNKILAIRLSKEYQTDKNLTGLIANQLMSKYQRPVLLLNQTEDEEHRTMWEGSGRNYDKADFENFKDFLNNSGFVEYGEGHQSAFGCGIYDYKFNEFLAYVNNALKDLKFEPCYKVDFIFQGNRFDGNNVIEIAQHKDLWGQSIDEPLIVIENLNVHKDNISLMSADKNPTLKIQLNNGVSLIKFKFSKEEFETLKREEGSIIMNIVGKCAINEWNGRITPQLLIEDYEVIGAQKYYF